MNLIPILSLLLIAVAPLQAQKETIAECQEKLSSCAKAERGKIKTALAAAYFKDQDQEKAFSTFLEALHDIPNRETPPVSKKEKKIYEEALKTYLSHSAVTAQEASVNILDSYESIYKEHPNYTQLGFLIAISYANLGLFDAFFPTFYKSYKKYPQHYLAYKTKAILHIKLFEKGRTPEEKEQERILIIENLELAAKQFPTDSSLYKLTIAFSPSDRKKQVTIKNLNKIIEDNILVSRQDINFFVQQALSIKQKELAQQFLDKAKEWYQYSRAIDNAQEAINQFTS